MSKKIITNKSKNEPSFKINEEIKGYDTVRIVGDGIESKVLSLDEANEIADEMNLDLILINERTNPPIVRINDYSKYLYEVKKNMKKNKNNGSELKEIQLSVNIAINDLETKARKAREFIEDGDKVKVVLKMKGRELSRREENKKSIFQFITMLDDVAVPESMPKDEGNRTMVILKLKK